MVKGFVEIVIGSRGVEISFRVAGIDTPEFGGTSYEVKAICRKRRAGHMSSSPMLERLS